MPVNDKTIIMDDDNNLDLNTPTTEDYIDEVMNNESDVENEIDEPDTISTHTDQKTTAKEIDLAEIFSNITERDKIAQNEDINKLLDNSSIVQVCCAQSGYAANMTPLTYAEFFKMANNEASNYESKLLTYKTIFSKIQSTSCEDWDMKFSDFLKATSIYDLETLCYGIFCATYQNEGKYTFKCPKCKNNITVVLDHNKIQHTANRSEMEELSEKIMKDSTNIDKLQEYSLVIKKPIGCKLNRSGLVCEIRIPSLYNMLQLLKEFTDEQLAIIENERDNYIITILLAINGICIPYKDKNTTKYSRVNTRTEIYDIINNLSPLDYAELKDFIINNISKYHVSYSIENIECQNPECKHKISYIPINLEEILFAHIASLT